MAYQKGDILWVPRERRNPRRLKHAAIIWDDFFDGDSDFYGIMLTHSKPSENFDNILMNDNHFEEGHEITFDNTHFVNQLFTKFHDWGPFHLSGRLTHEGIQFIEAQLSNLDTVEYEIYRDR